MVGRVGIEPTTIGLKVRRSFFLEGGYCFQCFGRCRAFEQPFLFETDTVQQCLPVPLEQPFGFTHGLWRHACEFGCSFQSFGFDLAGLGQCGDEPEFVGTLSIDGPGAHQIFRRAGITQHAGQKEGRTRLRHQGKAYKRHQDSGMAGAGSCTSTNTRSGTARPTWCWSRWTLSPGWRRWCRAHV